MSKREKKIEKKIEKKNRKRIERFTNGPPDDWQIVIGVLGGIIVGGMLIWYFNYRKTGSGCYQL